MSVAHLIDEARRLSHYEGAALVIFNRPANQIRLTLEWDEGFEKWRGTCSDGNLCTTFLAPTTTGADDVHAVAGALDAYLDAVIHGLGSKKYRAARAAKRSVAERVGDYTQR